MNDVSNSVAELTRCVKELKMPGVQIGSHIEARNLDDKHFDPLWAVAEELVWSRTPSFDNTACLSNPCNVNVFT